MAIRWYKGGKLQPFDKFSNDITPKNNWQIYRWYSTTDYFLVQKIIDDYTCILYNNFHHEVNRPLSELLIPLTQEELDTFIKSNNLVSVHNYNNRHRWGYVKYSEIAHLME